MIRYITLGSNDIPRSKRFYDAALGVLGISCTVAEADELAYGAEQDIWIVKPHLAAPATWGNGTMLALNAATRGAVDAFHKAALANGGFDEGAPGLRPYRPNFYACYARDPDGNKLSAVCDKAE
jgi:catechol 2,3-dioxygenase-like lactoylglutathione lyase family enzyme